MHRNIQITRCGAKPSISPPGCAASRLAAFSESPFSSVDKTNKKWLPWQRPLTDRKNNFRSFIYSLSSTSPANLPKICSVDFEITGLTGIVKNIS